ncbi:MAG: transposase [Nitrospirae bacterium]|nr:transposase [Nitrospirota bacterium]
MPRIARAVAAGFPHHIVQRGNNKEKVFFKKKDRDKYLSLLKKYSDKWESPILAYCLMGNHVHLLTRPKKEESLCKMMQGITLCYTQYINKTYNRTGRLWESRYHSCIIDEDKYLWAAARYIEQNPVRAKIVKKAEDYQYSSAKAHISSERDEVLGEELFGEGQRKGYIGLIKADISRKEMNGIRYSTKTGRPFGSEGFIKRMEKRFERKFEIRPPGRPKKKKSK